MPFVAVVTPMYGGMCNGTYAGSLAKMVAVFMNAGMALQFGFTMNESLVTRARDGLVYDFMQTECTHLMFIDADIGFEAQDVLDMVAADKDIICGLYPRKEIDWNQVTAAVRRGVPPEKLSEHTGALVVNTLDGTAPIEQLGATDQPIEVLNAGTGFMLIKREVLEGLADKVPEYHGHDSRHGGVIKQYFDTSIDGDHAGCLLSEDYHFCKLARAHGYQIWVAPWVKLTHAGAHLFSANVIAASSA